MTQIEMKRFKKYLKIWWIMSSRSTQIALSSWLSAVIFVIGKLLRFAFFFFFLVILISKTNTIAGYSFWQVIFFFATFNLIDTAAQLFMREVYRFRSYVVSGEFDYFLAKPLSPLFRTLLGGSDILDVPMLFLSVLFVIVAAVQIEAASFVGVLLYLVLTINAFIIALSFHVMVVALCVITTEIDNALWMYRDLTAMGRVPIDIYREPVRMLITFVVPVGIMITFPSKALMGLLSIQSVFIALLIGVVFLYGSYKFWQYSIRHYSSASS
ncbi:MAG: ABC-2 family transporter protein [Patescibacteria group bacterium]